MREAIIMRTGNPALNDKTFGELAIPTQADAAMTVQGTVNKTFILLFLVFLTAGWTWNLYFKSPSPDAIMPWTLIGAIGGFIVALLTIFKPQWSSVTAPIYSLLQGVFLGGISAYFESMYPGIVIQAVGLTFATCLGLLIAYRSGLIKATENFKSGVIAATGGIAIVYVVTIILGFFGIRVPYIHEGGLIGIGFSLFVVTVAALNLVLDFDFIEKGSQGGAPKFMEWYGAFGLMVTLIWLYIEILRLLTKLRQR